MSDSSNQAQETELFNSNDYIQSLCINSKIKITEQENFNFLPGWKEIVDKLIKSIYNYPIQLTVISDLYNALEVKFIVLERTREVNIWRSIEEARQESKVTCAQCGGHKRNKRESKYRSMFCDSCTENAGLHRKTGTWLDKF